MIPAFHKFASHINQGSKISKAPAIIIELLSSLQIIQLIFLTLFYFAKNDHVMIQAAAKSIRFITGGFHFDQYHEFPNILHTIWFLCISYLKLCGMSLVFFFAFSFNRIIFNRSLIRTINIILIFHSRVLFYPIQFFFLTLLSLYKQDSCNLNSQFFCDIGWFLGTVAFCVINLLLALVKEFILYQTAKTKDFYAIKTNAYHQGVLLYKMIILILLLTNQKTDAVVITSSFFHVLFNFGLLSVLYSRLPFYKFQILKIAVIMSTLSFCLSIASLFQACITNDEVRNSMQIVLLLLPILGIKIAMSIFKTLFERILKSEFHSPNYAIHFSLLLKQLTYKINNSYISDLHFFPDMNNFSGILTHKKINFTRLRDQSENKKEKLLLYECILEKLELCLKRYPDSQNLIIFLATFYLKKFGNVARPLELLRKLEGQKSSIYMLSSIEHLNRLLKRIRRRERENDKNKLNLDIFFRYKGLAGLLRSKMKIEIQKHLEFWKDIQNNTVDVKTTVKKVEEIDNLFMRIEKQFKRDSPDFQANFQFPILMYAVYLNNVRHLPHEAGQLLQKFQVLVVNQMQNFAANIDSDTTTVVIISLEPNKAGQIIDVTESMQNIFELKKKDVIGLNFGCFFPQIIAQGFQQEIMKYVKSPNQKLDKTYRAYGKNIKGEFFDIEVNFQLHSHFGNDIRAAVIIKQLSPPRPLMVVDYDGNILEFSKDMLETFYKENFNPKAFRKLQDISYEFERINNAFNGVYGNNFREYKPSFGVTISNFDIEDEKKLQTTEIEDTQKNTTRFTFDTNHEIPMMSSYRDDDTLALNSTKKDSQRALIHSPFLKSSPSKSVLNSALLSLKKGLRLEIPNDQSQKLCNYFIKGRRLILFANTGTPTKKNYQVKGDVQIKPYFLGNSFYKVVCMRNVQKDKFKKIKIDSVSELSNSQFADNFPYELERETPLETFSGAVNLIPVTMSGIDKFTPSLILDGKEKSKTVHDTDKTSDDEIQHTPTHGNKNNQLVMKTKVHIDDQKSSIMDFTFKESRFIKTLKEISVAKKTLPAFKITVFAIFIVLIFILTLAAVSYSLSRKATIEVDVGIEIVYWATEALVNAEKAWGWMLFLFAKAIGVGLFDDDTLYELRMAVYNNMLYLGKSSNILKNLLANLNAEDFLKTAFAKDISMYNPFGLGLNQEVYDIFTATDVLIPKYLSMIKYDDIFELNLREDLIFNLNNTSNDYLLRSKNLITGTEGFLQSTISENLRTLRIVLISQGIALVLLIALLLSLAFIVIKAYKKLFQILIKVRDESIKSQIQQLEKAAKYFDEQEIEHNTFIQASYDMFDDFRVSIRKKVKQIQTSAQPKRGQNFTSTRMNLYLLALTGISLLFIPALIGLFSGSLFGSMATFRYFESVKNQVGILSSAMYQANLFLYSFGYMVIFGTYETMLIHNTPPAMALMENIRMFSDVNNLLNQYFLKQEDLDPLLLSVLRDTICPYLEVEIRDYCEKGTNDGLNGLMSVNADYLQTSIFYITSFMENPTFENAMMISVGYIEKANPTLNIINYAYPFMVQQTLRIFHSRVKETLEEEKIYFIGVCVTILAATIVIYFISINKLKNADLGRRKILKIIPFSVFQENRTLSYYLRVHFSKEVETIKNII